MYLDDVIVYFKTLLERPTHVPEALQLLPTAEKKLKLAMSTFFDYAMFYIGHTIRPVQLKFDKLSPVAIERATAPTNQDSLRIFFGIRNVYQRVVPGFAEVATPLNKKNSKGKPFEFKLLTDTESDAFRELRERLTSLSMLAVPLDRYKYTSDTELCVVIVGYDLLQRDKR